MKNDLEFKNWIIEEGGFWKNAAGWAASAAIIGGSLAGGGLAVNKLMQQRAYQQSLSGTYTVVDKKYVPPAMIWTGKSAVRRAAQYMIWIDDNGKINPVFVDKQTFDNVEASSNVTFGN